MDYFSNISYMLSHIFLMLFIYLFITHRYSKAVTRLICVSSFLSLCITDILKLNIFPDNDLCYFFVTIFQILVTQCTGILISSKRNSKVLFIGLSASNYTIFGSVTATILYIYGKNQALALFGNFMIHSVLLFSLYKSFRRIWLQQYEKEYTTGWWELCLIPSFFIAVFLVLLSSPIPFTTIPRIFLEFFA